MNKIQLTALEKSITHWDLICQGFDTPAGENCACCKKFGALNCAGCPVFAVYGWNCKDLGWSKLASYININQTLPEARIKLPLSDWLRAIELSELILIRLLGLLPSDHHLIDQLPSKRKLQRMDFKP